MQPFILCLALAFGIAIGAKAALAISGEPKPLPTNITTVADILDSNDRLKDYQILYNSDSFLVYNNGARIGATLHGIDGIDSVILADNK
jgi:hypothetical protein